MVSFTNCDALIIKNKGMAASVRSIISLCIIMIYECKLAIRSSNNCSLVASLRPFITGTVMVDGLNRHPVGRSSESPLPLPPGDLGPCAKTPTSHPECPTHEFFPGAWSPVPNAAPVPQTPAVSRLGRQLVHAILKVDVLDRLSHINGALSALNAH